MSSSFFVHNLGFPRIGTNRELKTATEKYWQGKITQKELQETGAQIRKQNWLLQQKKGIQLIPSNDFSFYDQVLDTAALVGAVPERFKKASGEQVDLDTYFAMARGLLEKDAEHQQKEVFALEMLKWFDTNYHYMVPEFLPTTEFSLSSSKVFDEFSEALALGITTKPVLIGPLTFLLLGKAKQEFDVLTTLLPRLVPLYETVLKKLSQLGAQWIQVDEPVLVKDLEPNVVEAVRSTYATLASALSGSNTKIILATYFDDLSTAAQDLIASLPVHAFHIDLTRGSTDAAALAKKVAPTNLILSLGVVDGRNIWKANYAQVLPVIEQVSSVLPADRIWLAPSSSLIHSPINLDKETKLDPALRSVLSFATEKLDEIVVLARLAKATSGDDAARKENTAVWTAFSQHPALNRADVRARLEKLTPADYARHSSFSVRKDLQRAKLNLPLFPTTTIGSLPQTAEVRSARLRLRKGELTPEAYKSFIEGKIREGIAIQEELGLDVLVTGEFERNDMVEYFGINFQGFAFTDHGWVQSFGSRYVKPPIIWADVTRPHAVTVAENVYAQSLTKKPVKGMLTGPVTILQWSFVRVDQPREKTTAQIALAVRDEVHDLVAAGVNIVQVDEPAFREGLPIKKERWEAYLNWASKSFRLATSGVNDDIQIHTHMCYCEFSDMIQAILALDADVISIESSRSQMKLLPVFSEFKYSNEIGPGVFDIHSPTIPDVPTLHALLQAALKVLPSNLLWVNPDCGLKTRQWVEVKQQLSNMVQAARLLREEAAKK